MRKPYQPSQILTLAIAALLMVAPTLADQPQAGFRGDATSSGAAANEAFIVVANTAGLSAERALATAASTRISITDGGANGAITLDTGTNIPLISAGNSWSAAQIPSAFGTIDLGSTTRPWKDIYLANGGANYSILRSGTLTGNRIVTFPDANSNTVQPDTGASNNFLTAISSSGVISKAQPAFSNLSGNATVAQGGTNITSYTAGDLLYATGATTLAKLGIGTANQQLRTNAGATAPEWFTPSAASNSFTLSAKSGNFTASDGANYYYRISATATITLPASPADGSVRKFVQTSGTGTFAFNGAETVLHADGTSDQSLTIAPGNGTIELIARSGGWDET